MRAGAEPPLPSFLVIGAQKSGTHWVRDNLRAHPDIFMPAEELHVFTRPEQALAAGADAYRRCFDGWEGQPVVGEATPGYLIWKHRPAAMADAIDRLLPGVRLVAVLRNPVDRTFSAFVHFRRLGQIPADVTDVATAIERAGPPEEDELCLLAAGWYAASLRPYVERFGDRLRVLLLDDVEADPAGSYAAIAAHVGATSDFLPPDVARPRFAYDPGRYGVAPLDDAARRELFAHFEADVADLEVLLGRDLTAWRPDDVAAAPRGTRPVRLLDLGCGDGGSLIDAQIRFGRDGVGIELDPARVERARRRGLDVRRGDIRALDPNDFPDVEVVRLDNVLEHLADLDEVDRVLGVACRLASRLVSIRHPSFEDVDHLAALGLKLHWTDWPDAHTAPARVHELVALLNGHGCYDVTVRPEGLIRDSANPLVLPLDAPPNQVRPDPAAASVYRADRHGPKPTIVFDRPVWTMFEIDVVTGDGGAPHPTTGAPVDLPGHAPRSWPAQLRPTIGADPVVVERPDGGAVVVEGDLVRPVSGPVLARALRLRFGTAELGPDELAARRPGPPVVLLKAPGQSAFVVVGGRRLAVPALGFSLHAGDEWFTTFDEDRPLDPLRAAGELQDERRRRDQ